MRAISVPHQRGFIFLERKNHAKSSMKFAHFRKPPVEDFEPAKVRISSALETVVLNLVHTLDRALLRVL